MKRWVLLSLAVLAIGTAACTGSEAGTAHPTQPATETAPTSGDGSPPKRPRALPLDGVDPCEIITEQQRESFGIDRPPLGDEQPGGPLKGSPTCSYRNSEGETGFLIISSTSLGLAEYVDNLRESPTRHAVEVGGFPGIQDGLPGSDPGNDACFVDVDVADGQLLEVQFGQIASSKPLPMETLCAKALEVAEAALTTLQGLR